MGYHTYWSLLGCWGSKLQVPYLHGKCLPTEPSPNPQGYFLVLAHHRSCLKKHQGTSRECDHLWSPIHSSQLFVTCGSSSETLVLFPSLSEFRSHHIAQASPELAVFPSLLPKYLGRPCSAHPLGFGNSSLYCSLYSFPPRPFVFCLGLHSPADWHVLTLIFPLWGSMTVTPVTGFPYFFLRQSLVYP